MLRAEYWLAASMMGAGVALPAALFVALGDAGPAPGARQEAPPAEGPATLTTPVFQAPPGLGPRAVVIAIELSDGAAANALCDDYPRLADRIHLYLHEAADAGRDGATALGPALAAALARPEIEAARIVPAARADAASAGRTHYRCRGAGQLSRP
ncbi:MAG: hypothetical protein NXI21_14910 [Alphaproteobacteria bacterium]|nr:hypothetical protein [Alphaproteobacteria bacterium]